MDRLLRLTALALAAALALAFAESAAAQELRGFALVYATRSIDFFARPDAAVRPGEADSAERFLADVRRRLGQTDGPRRVSYYRVGHRVDVAALVGRDADGVTSVADARVVAVQADNRHELVHVAAGELGDPGRFFHEGLAVALAGDKGWSGRALERAAKAARLGLRRVVDDFDGVPVAQAYAVAGSFVAHLARRHGLDAVASFFRACDGRRRTREAAFVAAFGRDLAAAESEWRATL